MVHVTQNPKVIVTIGWLFNGKCNPQRSLVEKKTIFHLILFTFFKKTGQTRPLFVYFRSFHMRNIAQF